MPVRIAVSAEERLMDDALWYTRFADAYGWTPTQVDETPIVVLDRMLTVKGELDLLRAEAAKK